MQSIKRKRKILEIHEMRKKANIAYYIYVCCEFVSTHLCMKEPLFQLYKMSV